MLGLQAKGYPWYEAYAASFKESPKNLAKRVDQYAEQLSKGVPTAFLYVDISTFSPDYVREVRKVPSHEAALIFGEKLDSVGRARIVEALLRKAIALGGPPARTQAALASYLSRAERFDEAQALLDDLDLESDHDARTLTDLGESIQRRAESIAENPKNPLEAQVTELQHQAMRLYERSVEKDPLNAEGWFGLGKAKFATGEPEEAVAAYRQAYDVGEFDSDLMLEWGVAAQQIKKKAVARQLWGMVFRDGGSAAKKRAKKLLDAMNAPSSAIDGEAGADPAGD